MALTEDEIRPYRFEEGKLAALERDLDWLRARRKTFITVDCPACGGRESQPAFEKFGFHFQECAQCGTVYMNPRATPELLQEFYARSQLYEYWNAHIFPASRDVRREKIFRPRVQRVAELCCAHNVSSGTIIDVGAANAAFCEEAQKLGAFGRVVAIEPGHALAQSCRDYGIETFEATMEVVQGLDGAADVVASFETLEHVFSPRDFLMQCARFLRLNGLLVLTCPNWQGFDIQTLGVESESLDAEHVNLFNPQSLTRLVESVGFAVIECTTPGRLDAELVRKKVLDGVVDLSKQPFLRTVLIDRWDTLGVAFQDFLRANGLSSHMWLVAQRAKS